MTGSKRFINTSGENETQANRALFTHTKNLQQVDMKQNNSGKQTIEYDEYIETSIIKRLTVKNLTARYPSKAHASVINVSFSLRQGQMMAIMGPSGSGKSSLIQALLNRMIVEEGQIIVNGKRCVNALLDFKTRLGFAPQDDILDDSLTVFENLYFYQKLKSHNDQNNLNIETDIDTILESFNIIHKRNKRVISRETKLSGGQRRRLNMAMELLNNPDILILDEPTSGLSSKDSEQLVSLLKKLTCRGKMVFLVIHQPSSTIYKMFDKVLIVDGEGEQLFCGAPLDALEIFNRASKAPDISKEYVECPNCKNVRPDVLLNAQTDAPPEFWNAVRSSCAQSITDDKSILQDDSEEKQSKGSHDALSKFTMGWRFFFNQLALQTKRQMLSKSRDRLNQLFSFVIPPLLGILGALVFRFTPDNRPYSIVDNEHYVHFLFLIVITGMFFGLMASVFEVIKDKTMLQRENLGGASVGAYFFSKFIVLTMFAAIQSFTFLVPAHWILDVKNMLIVNGGLMILITSIGIGFGMLFSTLTTSVLAAYNLVPLILIPQIILGGGFLPYQQMSPSLYAIEKGWRLTLGQNKGMKEPVNKYKAPIIARLLPASWALEFLVTANYHFHPVRKLKSEKQYALEQVDRKYDSFRKNGKLTQNDHYLKRKDKEGIRRAFDLKIKEEQDQLNIDIGDMGAGLTLLQKGEFNAQYHDWFQVLSANRLYNDVLSKTWVRNVIVLLLYLTLLYVAGFLIIRSIIQRR